MSARKLLYAPSRDAMTFQWIFRSKAAAQAVAILLALQLTGSHAAGQSIPTAGPRIPTALNIIVVQGEGAAGQVMQRAAQDPSIRVVDEREEPVTGAAVVFILPTEGATGTFGNGAKTLTVLTDAQGVATAQGLRFNQIPGKVPIHVNASYKGLTARASITEVSGAPAGYEPPVAKRGGGHGKLFIILAIVAAGGAGGAVAAMHGSGSSSSPASTPPVGPAAIGLTAGVGSLAPPH